MTVRWNLHVCALNGECRRYAGWCWRLGILTPWCFFSVALRPSDRFAKTDGSADWTTFQRRTL